MPKYEVVTDGVVVLLTQSAPPSEQFGVQHKSVSAVKGDKFRTADEAGDEPVLSPVVLEQLEDKNDRIHEYLVEVSSADEKSEPAKRGRPAKAKTAEENEDA